MPANTSHHNFSIREALFSGWNTVRENFLLFIGIWGVVFVVHLVSEIIAKTFNDTAPFLSFLAQMAAVMVQLVILLGSLRIALKLVEHKRHSFSDLFSTHHLLLSFIIGTFLYVCIVIIGMILLVVPGVIWAIQFRFFPFVLIEKKVGVLEAFEKSSKLTQGIKWKLFLFYLSLGGVMLLGILAAGVGVLIAIPIALVASAHVYHKLAS